MIISFLQGGLGNQMFEYAAAKGLAVKRGTKVMMDVSWFTTANQTDGVDKRHYELDGFNLEQAFYRRTLAQRLQRKAHGGRFYEEGNKNPYQFYPEVLELPDYTILVGLYQNERYFKHAQTELLQDFSWRSAATGKNRELLAEIEANPGSVSVHVRRGDYATSKVHKAHHGLMGLDYYETAMKELRKKVARPTAYVFSNDPEWCKQNLKLGVPTVYVDHNDPVTQGIEDMRLMKSCGHHIIANSSFSWWGAWLDTKPGKIVYAPKLWLANGAFDTSDAVPKEWISL